MYWLTENSMVPMLTGVFMVIAFLALGFWARERRMLYVALIFGAITSAIVLCEFMIVTDQEAVTDCVQELAMLVRANDGEGVVGYVSPNRPEVIEAVRREMKNFDFDQCRITGVKTFESTESGGRKTAKIVFVVFARVKEQGMSAAVPVQPEVTLDFVKESDGKWRVQKYSYRRPNRGSL